MKIIWDWYIHNPNDGTVTFYDKDEYEADNAMELLQYIAGLTADFGSNLIIKNVDIV